MKNFFFRPAMIVLSLFGLLATNSCGQNSAAFKTYTNTAFNYQISYPSSWTAEGVTANVAESIEMTFYIVQYNAAKEKGMTMVTVHPYQNPNSRTPKDWYLNDSKVQSQGIYPYPAAIIASTEETTVNGYPAYKITTNDGGGMYDYFVGQGNFVYRLSFEKFSGDTTLPADTFTQILQSFKITK